MSSLITTIATYAVAGAAVSGFLRMVWRGHRRMARIADILDFVEAELKPNHGSSLRDAIDRLERDLSDHIKYHMDKGEQNVH